MALAGAAVLPLALGGGAESFGATASVPAGKVARGYSNNAVPERTASAEAAAKLLRKGGARIDRVAIGWKYLEPTPGDFRWATYDAIYTADLNRGVKPLFTFGFAPRWASGEHCIDAPDSCLAPPTPEYYEDYASAAAKIAARYPRAAGIEIWNEPNTPHYWGTRPDPVAYTSLLQTAYRAIKEAQPDMRVAGGATAAGVGSLSTGKISGPDFIGAMYQQGAKPFMDVITVHAYPLTGDLTGVTALAPIQGVGVLREWFDDTSKPVWVTETGISRFGAVPITAAVQAEALLTLDSTLRKAPGVEMVLFHEMIERDRATGALERGYGVVSRELEPRPGYCTLARAWGKSPC